tara:strand:+ start:723 stop:1229 length:507 start_codon:yes stop_codon:yes gene_type:complete
MITNQHFSAKADIVYTNGREMRMTCASSILTAMGVGEFFWDGTQGYKENMVGERTVLVDTSEFEALLWLADNWMSSMSVVWGWSSMRPFRCQNNTTNELFIQTHPEDYAHVLSVIGETSIGVDPGCLCQIYLAEEDASYIINNDGTKSPIVWGQGKKLYQNLSQLFDV